jgi:hypothetical protein
MTPNLPTPRVTAAIPARAAGMAAIANKRDTQTGRARSFRCWNLGWHSRQGCILAELDLLVFAYFFRFWYGFLSDFSFFDAKKTEKPHDISIENTSSMHACAFLVLPEMSIILAVLLEWYWIALFYCVRVLSASRHRASFFFDPFK